MIIEHMCGVMNVKTIILKSYKIVVVFSFVLVIFYNLFLPSKVYSHKPITYYEVTIQSGDTLWNLAKTYNLHNTDVRKIVYEIRKFNNISENKHIQPGDIINIPILE